MIHRPYSLKQNRGKYPPSVTTVLDVFGSGGGLKWWAGDLVANRAINTAETWFGLPRDEAFRYLRFAHDVQNKADQARGTIVHTVNERWAAGLDADLDELVSEHALIAWQGREDQVASEISGYVDALERFWTDRRPEFVGIEEVVLHEDKGSHSYIGQRDFTARLVGLDGVTLLDIKTLGPDKAPTASEPYKGVYLDRFRLQLAAYRGAETLVRFDDDGNETGREAAYPIARCCVLALRHDGSYHLLEVRAGGDELAHFYRVLDLWRYAKDADRVPAPVDHTPVLVAEEVAA